MSRIRSSMLAAALIGLAAYGSESPMFRETIVTPPEVIKRKRNKAEKKRAKRAARNLRLAAHPHPTQQEKP